MKDDHRTHPLRHSQQDRVAARAVPDTPQTRSPAYSLAFADDDFLCRDELRPVRLQLELLKPQMMLDEAGVESTIVLFGGARIPEPSKKAAARTQTLADLSDYYEEARKFAHIMTQRSLQSGHTQDVVVTGGGPGAVSYTHLTLPTIQL